MALPARRSGHGAAERSDPLAELDRLSQQLSGVLGMELPSLAEGFTPLADIEESDDAFTVELELPGVRKDDIAVEVSGRRLTSRASARSASGSASCAAGPAVWAGSTTRSACRPLSTRTASRLPYPTACSPYGCRRRVPSAPAAVRSPSSGPVAGSDEGQVDDHGCELDGGGERTVGGSGGRGAAGGARALPPTRRRTGCRD